MDSNKMSNLLEKMSLAGKKGLVMGIANQNSIAYGCARAFHELGAELMLTYAPAKSEAYVRPLAESLGQAPLMLCDVQDDMQLEAVFKRIEKDWGKLDFLLHSIAFAPGDDLHGRVIDSSREGFLQAMDISCHSFMRMAKQAEPLMKDGGCLLTMSYYGAHKVIDNYNLMGPVKAALESSVRYMAAELGAKGIRVHAISPGPLNTRAASGIADFDQLLDEAAARAPDHQLVSIDDVGAVAACLVSDAAAALTGNTAYVDSGFHIMA